MDLKNRIKGLNVEIRNYFYFEKRNNVRRKIISGNSKSLWSAVKSSKDIGANILPVNLTDLIVLPPILKKKLGISLTVL